jgi:TonB-dependent SusC/RagA subfamily outer membrane receptor
LRIRPIAGFFYKKKTVNETTKVSISLRHVSIETVVSSLLMNTAKNVSFKIRGDQIMLKKVKKPEAVSFAGNAMKGLPEMEGNSVLSGASRLSLASSFVSYQLSITGTVSSQGGEPIPGVNILQKGTTNGTTTDADGKYSIVVPEGDAVLVFSFIGYATQEVTINGRSVINVALVEDVQSLDEVVVVGYGTQQKVNLTASVTMVDAKEMADISAPTVSQAMMGRSRGVFIKNGSGQPGEDGVDINIRGFGSPLIIVDGVPVSEAYFQQIHPNDIEQFNILKDASAAAVYGPRAGNGVILVTTKRGTVSAPKFSFDSNLG